MDALYNQNIKQPIASRQKVGGKQRERVLDPGDNQ